MFDFQVIKLILFIALILWGFWLSAGMVVNLFKKDKDKKD
tara:strand:- start:3926 stop:4045 length:120 start_codon:yes stop_codon:yes gene_type:complete